MSERLEPKQSDRYREVVDLWRWLVREVLLYLDNWVLLREFLWNDELQVLSSNKMWVKAIIVSWKPGTYFLNDRYIPCLGCMDIMSDN